MNDLFKIKNAAQEAIHSGIFPGVELFLSKGKETLYHESFGQKAKEDQTPLDPACLFDLASITKPLATTVLLLRLVEKGKLKLSDRLSHYLPACQCPETEEITILDLLTHRSGFAAWEAFYEPVYDKDAAIEKLLATKPIHPLGAKVVYSCLNFFFLAQVYKKITASSIQDDFEALLATSTLTFQPKKEKSIPTAYCKLRQRMLIGEVHDENASTFGKDAGNAGLFGSALGVFAYLQKLLAGEILSPASLEIFFQNHNPSTLHARALGWDYNDQANRDHGHASCGVLMPIGSVGHLGFTGTSLWVDPKSELILLILSSRVNLHYSENQPLMREFRPKMHDLLLQTFL